MVNSNIKDVYPLRTNSLTVKNRRPCHALIYSYACRYSAQYRYKLRAHWSYKRARENTEKRLFCLHSLKWSQTKNTQTTMSYKSC